VGTADKLAFRFVGGRLCLDFVATLGQRGITDLERLRTPADLARWAVEAGLCERPPAVRDPDLSAARTLREAIHRLVTRSDDPPARTDLRTVNELAGRPPAPTLTWSPAGLVATSQVTDADGLLAATAADAVSLLTGQDAGRVRKCQAPDCTLLFVDQSQNGRAWCAMNACGAKAKMRTLRERRRSH
jgi:predicted RNA-binding Zn ribbon-like protein